VSPKQNQVEAVELALIFNAEIVALAEPADEDDDSENDFLCQCGCMNVVPLTHADFLATGAWVEGHKPK
jgi:hypothetical protein